MTTAPTQVSKHQAQTLIASYLILNIASGTVAGAMQIAVPLYALSLKAALAQVGLIRGTSGIGTLLLVIPAGFLVDHYGSRRLFLLGALVGTIATFCLTFARVPANIALIMGLAGLFSSLKMIALNSSFFSNLQTMGIEKAGWFKGSMSIGLTFIGPVLGGFLVHSISFALLFKLLALMTLIPIALVLFFLKDPVRQRSSVGLKEAIRRQATEFRALIGQRDLYLPLATETITTAFFATFSTFIVVLAVHGLHLQPTIASFLLTIEGGFFILTVFAAGRLIRVLTEFQLYALSASVVIAGLILLATAVSFRSLSVAAVVLGLGLGLINLVVSSRIGSMQGDKGKVVGLFSAAVSTGASAGPMLGGLVGSWLGTRAIFLSFAPVFVLLAVAAGWQQRQRHTSDEPLSASEMAAERDPVAASS